MKANIELNIDKLVLHGFPKKDGAYIGRAVEQELTRLMQNNGVPADFSKDSAFKKLNASTLNYTRNDRPEKIGREIAQLIYKSFSNQNR